MATVVNRCGAGSSRGWDSDLGSSFSLEMEDSGCGVHWLSWDERGSD